MEEKADRPGLCRPSSLHARDFNTDFVRGRAANVKQAL